VQKKKWKPKNYAKMPAFAGSRLLCHCAGKDPAELAKEVSQSLSIPTIGIGAGKDCDGQVLVMHDMLGINNEFKPRFLRQYLNLENR
jgi:3-methyl-2-oxobutanoate hydroxymethyltransferase